jgi:hypothetical protein
MRRMLEGGSIVQYLCVAILRIVEIFVETVEGAIPTSLRRRVNRKQLDMIIMVLAPDEAFKHLPQS